MKRLSDLLQALADGRLSIDPKKWNLYSDCVEDVADAEEAPPAKRIKM